MKIFNWYRVTARRGMSASVVRFSVTFREGISVAGSVTIVAWYPVNLSLRGTTVTLVSYYRFTEYFFCPKMHNLQHRADVSKQNPVFRKELWTCKCSRGTNYAENAGFALHSRLSSYCDCHWNLLTESVCISDNPCFSAPCLNGATCVPPFVPGGTMRCLCQPGYEGQFCGRGT